MTNKVYITTKVFSINSFLGIDFIVDGVIKQVTKNGNIVSFDIESGKHILEIVSNINHMGFIKVELDIDKPETYLIFSNIVYIGKLVEVTKKEFYNHMKGETLSAIFAILLGILYAIFSRYMS